MSCTKEKELKFNWGDWINGLKVKEFIDNECKLISFSQNFTRESGYCECGCNHPRMWAQYAENNKGACIVINEERFIKRNEEILSHHFWKIKNVKYLEYLYTDETINNNNPQEFIEANYQKLFFEKYIDWVQEDERRLLIIGNTNFLSIDGCIEFICLGNKFENYSKLTDLLLESIDKEFNILTPHDFSFQSNTDGRILASTNAFRIIEHLRKKEKNITKYWEHLNNNGYTL